MSRRSRIPLIYARYSLRFFTESRPLCTSSSSSSASNNTASAGAGRREQVYRQLENLDFKTAANILFNAPKKKFGLDFHLVQFFFVCMPSLAVYLVAQYARYEIRRMEAEVEMKKKLAEEEEKAKETELNITDKGPDSELSKVIVRLDTLEEAVKEIMDEKKKDSSGNLTIDLESGKKEQVATAEENLNSQNKSKAGDFKPETSKETVSGSVPVTYVSAKDCEKQDTRAKSEVAPSQESTK